MADSQTFPKDPRLIGTKCDSCPFAIDGAPSHNPVWGVGPSNPIGVLVGEGPGPDEVEEGVPFVGPTGKQLDRELELVGLPREKLFICNATLCFPGEGKTSRKLETAVKCCSKAFEYQVENFRKQGKHFFVMGRGAALAVLNVKLNLTKGRGFLRGSEV